MEIPTLTDRDQWTDADLDALRIAVLTEQERRRTIATAPTQAETLATAYTAAIADQPADDWDAITAATDRVGPGQRVVVAGVEYRNKSGAWLPVSAGPEQDPHAIWWERVTPIEPTPTVAPWSATATYKPGDRCTRGGRLYECIVGHGAAYAGTWGPPAAGVWKDLGPA